jgi:hypothetical protein
MTTTTAKFSWKDRAGAVRQASYLYRLAQGRIEADIAAMSPSEIEADRQEFGPDFKRSFGAEGTLTSCCHAVLGTGSGYVGMYCAGVEEMTGRQWLKFVDDVLVRIARDRNPEGRYE